MAICTSDPIKFQRVKGRKVEAVFGGQTITSDGGEMYVFTNPRTGTGYTRQSREIKYLFQRVCEKAEVPLFTAHCLRHFVATHFNDPRRAQKILGHENLKTTEIYLHDLGVDMGAATIFESITHESDLNVKNGFTVLQ